MAEVIKGLDVVISVKGKVVAGQRNASLEMSAETMDTTTKLSGGWAEKIAGLKSWTTSLDGAYIKENTDGLIALETAFFNGEAVDLAFVKPTEASSGTYEYGYSGKAIITSMNAEAGQDDIVSYSISFDGTGALTPLKGKTAGTTGAGDVQRVVVKTK